MVFQVGTKTSSCWFPGSLIVLIAGADLIFHCAIKSSKGRFVEFQEYNQHFESKNSALYFLVELLGARWRT